MSALNSGDRDELARALHRERCDMGDKEWDGCDGYQGCEAIVDRALAPVVAQVVAANAATPEPCPHCGWQYDDEKLTAARRGEIKLDPTPTHLCGGGS